MVRIHAPEPARPSELVVPPRSSILVSLRHSDEDRTKEYGDREVSGHRIVRPLGSGSFGEVLEAKRDGVEKPVVLKLLDADLFGDAPFFEAFVSRRPSRHAAVACATWFECSTSVASSIRLYLACEHVSGVSLSSLIEHLTRSAEPCAQGLAILVASEIAQGSRSRASSNRPGGKSPGHRAR